MNISPTLQPAASQLHKVEPVVAGDRSRDVLSAAVTPRVKQASHASATVVLSPEALKLAAEELSAGNPESVRKLLSNHDLQNITPNDLSKLASTLFVAGVLSADEGFALIGTEFAYEKVLDPNKPLDAVKVMQDRLRANRDAGPSAMAGRAEAVRALDFIERLASFANSDRERI